DKAFFEADNVRKEDLLFLHQVNAEFFSQCGETFLHLQKFGVALTVYPDDLCRQGLDAWAFLTHENVVGAGDVRDQVGERLVLPVLVDVWRGGLRDLLQARKGFVNGDLGFPAGSARGPAPATTVVDSQPFEFACGVGYLGGDLANSLSGCDCHPVFPPASCDFPILPGVAHKTSLECPRACSYDFCHGDDEKMS